jgi:hypothetical protein
LNFVVVDDIPPKGLEFPDPVIPFGFSEGKSLFAQFLLLCGKKALVENSLQHLNVLREIANHGPAGYIDRHFKWSPNDSGPVVIENSQSPKCIDCSSWFAFHLYQRGIELRVEEDITADASDPRTHGLKLIIEDMIEKTKNSHIAIAHIDKMIVGPPFYFMIKNNAFGLRSLVNDLLALFTGVTEKKYGERRHYMERRRYKYTFDGRPCPREYIDIPIIAPPSPLSIAPNSTPVSIAITSPFAPVSSSECPQETRLHALILAISKTIEEMESVFKDQAYFEEIKSGGLARYVVPGHPDCANLGAWFKEVLDYCDLRGSDDVNEYEELHRQALEMCIEIMSHKISVSCIPILNIRYLVLGDELCEEIDGGHDPKLREMLLNLLGLFTGVEESYTTLSYYWDIHG